MVSRFISHGPGSQDPDTKRQFDQLQQSIGEIAENYTFWAGPYDGGCYPKGAIVVDGSWTMVSLTDTCDRPAPTPTGDPFYVYGGSSPTSTLVARSLTVGNQYTFPRGGFMVGYRVYTITGNVYTVWYQEEGGPVQQVAIITASSTGWIEQTLDSIPVPSETLFTLAVTVQEPDPTPVTFTGSYDYQTPQNPAVPAVGDITHDRNTSAVMAVNKTDSNSTDLSGDLAGLEPGDTLAGANLHWAINSITDMGTYYNFGVSPAANGFPTGVQQFTFETTSPTPITTVIDTDYFLGNSSVQPFFEIDGGGQQLSDAGYGIDIRLQEADVSDDWQVMSYSLGGAGGGGGDFVKKTGDTMTGVLAIEGVSGVPVLKLKRTDNAAGEKNGLIAKNSDGSIGLFGQSDDGQTLTNHASFGRQNTDNRLYSATYVENNSINSGILHVTGNNYPFLRLACKRTGSSYRHAGIMFDTPRSDTADGDTSGGRAMIKCYGDGTSTGNPILMLTTQTSNLQPTDGYSTDRDGNGNAMIMQGSGSSCKVMFYSNGGVLAGEISGAYNADPASHASGLFMTKNKCDQRYAQTAAFKAFLELLVVKGTLTQAEADTLDALNVVQL